MREWTQAEWEASEPDYILYRYWNDIAPVGHQLLYIGITHDFYQRDDSHRRRSTWRSQSTRVEVELHPNRQAAMLAEHHAIVAEVPIHNTTHTDVAKWQAEHGDWLAVVENRHVISESDKHCAHVIGDALWRSAS
jgi:predicted GIY-YIG superfamily endonuclease